MYRGSPRLSSLNRCAIVVEFSDGGSLSLAGVVPGDEITHTEFDKIEREEPNLLEYTGG